MSNDTSNTRLNDLRCDIDEIDRDLCQLIEERFSAVYDIAREKRTAGLPLFSESREEAVIAKCRALCPHNKDAVEAIYRLIFRYSKLAQKRRYNLYLVGMPNSGKSKFAGKLANMLNRRSVDTDYLVMHSERKSIDQIFDEYGEGRFRALEQEALVRTARIGGLVVATGGGILTNEANHPIIKNSGITVFLDRSIERLLCAKTRNRPLIREGEEAVIRLYTERHELYTRFADLTVDPDLPDCADIIADFFRSSIANIDF